MSHFKLSSTSVSSPEVYGSVAAFALLSHAYFKRFEPTVQTALWLLLISTVGFPSALASAYKLPAWDACIAAARLAGVYFATLYTSIAIYRLSPFHPLAKYPGPIMCKLSQFPWLRINMGLHARHWIEKMHETYGPIVRIGPNHLSWADAEAMQYAHGFKGAWERAPAYLHGIMAGKNPEDAALGRLRPRAAHRERRRIFEPAFVNTSLQIFEPVIYRCANRFLRLLERNQNKVIDAAEYIRFLYVDSLQQRVLHLEHHNSTWEFMNLAVFSAPQDTMDVGKDSTNMIDDTVAVARWGLRFDAMPWLRDIIFLVLPLPSKFIGVMNYAVEAFQQRLQGGPNQHVSKDLFSYLIDDDTGKHKLSEAQMTSDSFGLIFGAVDTTAQAFAVTIMFLLDQPETFKKLRAELEKKFEREAVNIRDTTDLPYLNACINESLRLISPIPSGVSRECPTDQVVRNNLIPAKTTCRFPTYVIQRDPANFSPDPKSFRPERWVNPEKEDAFNMSAYYPFNIGHHACIGRALALQELRYTIACTVLNFDMKLAPGYDVDHFFNVGIMDGFFATFTDPVSIIVEKRTDKAFMVVEDH